MTTILQEAKSVQPIPEFMRKAWGFALKSQARRPGVGAGDGNRTRVASLEDWNSTIELHPPPDQPILPCRRGLSIGRLVFSIFEF